MASTTLPLRWTWTVPTALGDTESSVEIDDTALRLRSDDPMGGTDETLRGRDRGHRSSGSRSRLERAQGSRVPLALLRAWVGAARPTWRAGSRPRLEWLILSHRAGAAPPRTSMGPPGVMRVLPQGPDRDAIVAALRERLGARWIGEQVPLPETQRRLKIKPDATSQAKVWGIVVAVMVALVGLILLMGILLHPVISVPARIAALES
ncbi:MAG: hypothetical protein ABIX46_10940, partial [Burkholderiaceae bacterium]